MHDFKGRLEILNQVSIIYRMYSHDANVADSISESEFLIKGISFPVLLKLSLEQYRSNSLSPYILCITLLPPIPHSPLPIAHRL